MLCVYNDPTSHTGAYTCKKEAYSPRCKPLCREHLSNKRPVIWGLEFRRLQVKKKQKELIAHDKSEKSIGILTRIFWEEIHWSSKVSQNWKFVDVWIHTENYKVHEKLIWSIIRFGDVKICLISSLYLKNN